MFNIPQKINNTECGLIQTKTNTDKSLNVRSCDLIKSDSTKSTTDTDIYRNSDNFYKNVDIKNDIYTKTKNYYNYIYTLCNPKVDVQTNNNPKCFPPTDFWKEYMNNLVATIKKLKSVYNFDYKNNDNHSFIYKLNIKPTDKIICIGDIHGGFHTFYRLIRRFEIMGVLETTHYKINDGYKIIFTGDIIDRGEYSIEIFSILFKFILNNTNSGDIRIIYNRGNHEELNTFTTYGFAQEIEKKINTQISATPDKIQKLIKSHDELFNNCPAATIIECDGSRYFIAHGGFSIRDITLGSDKKLIDSTPDIYTFTNDICIVKPVQREQIMWNDFTSIQNYNNKTVRGVGVKISKKEIDLFLAKNNIKFIIRGHQDSYGNSFLFKHNSDVVDIDGAYILRDNIRELLLKPVLSDTTKQIKSDNTVDGPIMELDITKFDSQGALYKVLTISTNTAFGRPLTFDSFIILKHA